MVKEILYSSLFRFDHLNRIGGLNMAVPLYSMRMKPYYVYSCRGVDYTRDCNLSQDNYYQASASLSCIHLHKPRSGSECSLLKRYYSCKVTSNLDK